MPPARHKRQAKPNEAARKNTIIIFPVIFFSLSSNTCFHKIRDLPTTSAARLFVILTHRKMLEAENEIRSYGLRRRPAAGGRRRGARWRQGYSKHGYSKQRHSKDN